MNSRHIGTKKGVVVLALTIVGVLTSAWSQTAKQITDATGVKSGLAVRLGTTDGATEAELAADGMLLVHGLALDQASCDAARAAIRAKGVYGVATVEKAPRPLSTLPYAENLVNVLVADLDAPAFQGLTEAEVMRTVVPEGFAYVKTNGTWAAKRKPRPAGMDEWRHFWHGVNGNMVSRDELVQPPTSLKWMAWYSKTANEGLHGPAVWHGRTAGGRFAAMHNYRGTHNPGFYLDCRDAFNGISLWVRKVDAQRQCPMILTDSRLYVTPSPDEPMRAFDAETGDEAMVFTAGGTLKGTSPASMQAILADGLLVEANGSDLFVLDTATGGLKARYTEPSGLALNLPVYDKARGHVIVEVSRKVLDVWRWSQQLAEAIIAVDVTTGQEIWRCTEFIGLGGGAVPQPNVSQLMLEEDKLVLFGPSGIGGGTPYLGCIRVTDGKLLWQNDYQNGMVYVNCGKWKPNYWQSVCPEDDPRPRGIYNHNQAIIYNGRIILAGGGSISEHRLEDGEFISHTDYAVPNQRCTRGAATPNHFYFGFQIAVDDQSKMWRYHQTTRSTCGTNPILANGMTYYGPNTMCGCFTMLRNQVGLSSEPLAPAVPDEARLERGPAALPKAPAQTTTINIGRLAKAVNFGAERPVATTGSPIRADWTNNDMLASPELLFPVSSGTNKYVSVINEHRLESRGSDGQAVWSFTAGGRISGAPVFTDGLCIFGSHDGYVYALRDDNGALVWRFLAGHNHRKAVMFSQIASPWPIFGVVINAGKVCVSAGHIAELDGGIQVWGIEPTTGAIAWKGVVRKDVEWVPRGDTRNRSVVNRTINSAPTSEDGKIAIPGVTIDPANPPMPGPVSAAVPNSKPRKPLAAPRLTVSNGSIRITWSQDASGAVFDLLNAGGRRVASGSIAGGNTIVFPTDHVAAGVYVLRTELRGNYHGTKVRLSPSY